MDELALLKIRVQELEEQIEIILNVPEIKQYLNDKRESDRNS